MLQHSGEKPFACNQCSFSCRRPSELKYHMLSHTGEKPFACKKCEYSCRQSHDLKMQMKKHIYETSTLGKWSISVILTLLCYDLRGEEDQGWEYRLSYRSKGEISNVFTALKSIDYRTSNIQFFKTRVFCLHLPKKLIFKAKNTYFCRFRSPRLPPPLICQKKSLTTRSS